ncbi:nucleotide disphospho-sugar-binding domain-containing protein [Actinokineospora enzanensis]|uniref:nucleotide disphospho-sugar-binding domain-containing protein n=1 Tax=Actinokineospora enzanensis TaxID=155975 RepID=UPI0003671A6D|nr:nucleotide disphospho-sugar-binding domain-containing protein [Actinokineospora enzanensis]
MRVLFTACAWPTHFLPMAPLAWALAAAGHEVRVAVPPALAAAVTAGGATPVRVGPDLDFLAVVAAATRPAPGDDRLDPAALRAARGARSMGMFGTVADAMLDDLLAFADWWRPHAVVYDPTAYAGRVAAAALGVPAVRHLFGPDLTERGRDHEPAMLAPLLRRAGTAFADLVDALTLDPCPRALQAAPAPTRQALRFVPYNGPGEVPAWLPGLPVRERVLVTAGTGRAGAETGRAMVRAVAAALEGTGVEVLAALGSAGRDRSPEGVRVAESVPLHLLLPACSAVVHHGGAGTMLTAMAAGLPQLGVAQMPEQVFNIHELARTGAGIASTVDTLTAAEVDRLRTDPALAGNARALADEMRAAPSPAELVGTLEKLAG